MTKAAVAILFAICLIYSVGCGGSSNGDETQVVRIQSTRVDPKVSSIRVGDSLQWINTDTQPHQIISGTLLPDPTPDTLAPISIQPGNTFLPNQITADILDFVRWRNDTGNDFTLDIYNDADQIVATLVFEAGEVKSYQFQQAGQFRFQQRGNNFFGGTATIYGIVPDQVNVDFMSSVLPNGGIFTRTFNTANTFPYFVINPSDPNRAFITGSVIVQ